MKPLNTSRICSVAFKSFSMRRLSTEYSSKIASRTLKEATAPLTHQKLAGRQRFYKKVMVEKVPNSNNSFRILLDGRVLKTPGRNDMTFHNELLATAVAAEWDFQSDKRRGLEPTTMPLMTLTCTALDQVRYSREEVIDNCVRYFPTDAALFFTEEADRILLNQQRKHLMPAIRWLNRHLGINIEPTTTMVGRIQHSDEAIAAVRKVLDDMDEFELTCVQAAVMECKSVVLALAFVKGFMSLKQTKLASRLEEEFQVEIWGVVEGGHDMDRLNNSINLSAVSLYSRLMKL